MSGEDFPPLPEAGKARGQTVTMRARLIPLVVACPIFLQNVDASALTVALPNMAKSLHVPPLQLNLVITAYLLSLAVFLPLSAWLADRVGPKRMFCLAIVLFSIASTLCGVATSTGWLVLFRVLQGAGAAMMVPVGRLILVRSVPVNEMMTAMVWYAVPPVVGRLAGPLVGGAIVSVSSWHWIFFVNIPFGLVAVVLAWLVVDDIHIDQPPKAFDLPGFLLIGCGLAALLGSIETLGKGLIPIWLSAMMLVVGAVLLALYVRRSWKQDEPVIDLRILKFPALRMNLVGAAPLRLAMTAAPFLLALMLQIGFGLSPLAAGLVASGSALGALTTRAVMRPAIRRYGFRRLLLGANLLVGVLYTSYALFSIHTPKPLMFCVVFFGGLLGSLCLTSLGTLGFVGLPPTRVSHATALSAMIQQLTAGTGVVVAAGLLSLAARLRGGNGGALTSQDFSISLAVVGPLALVALLSLRKMHPNEGKELY